MKRIILFTFCIVLFSASSSAQDKINLIRGRVIDCKITSIDSSKIEFVMDGPVEPIETFVEIDEVLSYFFEGTRYVVSEIDPERMNRIKEENDLKKYRYMDSIEHSNRCFLYIGTNYIISANAIQYKKPMFESNYFLVDSKDRFYPSMVKFYKDYTGFYARVRIPSIKKSYSYAERIEKGKINLYRNIYTSSSPGHMSPTGYVSGWSNTNITHYYNKGFSDLQYLSYDALYNDVSDCPECVDILKGIKRKSGAQAGLYAAGGMAAVLGAVIVGIYSGGESDEASYYSRNGKIAIGSGLGLIGVGFLFGIDKEQSLFEAVDAYNRQ